MTHSEVYHWVYTINSNRSYAFEKVLSYIQRYWSLKITSEIPPFVKSPAWYLHQKRALKSEKRARRSVINKTNPYSLTNYIKRLNSTGCWLFHDYTNCTTHLNITSLEIHIGLYLNRIVPAQPRAKVVEMTTIKLE